MAIKKEKKSLNIAQRVEILLREGIDNPETWMPLSKLDNESSPIGEDAWAIEYKKLSTHHDVETKFLFEIIRELCEQVHTLDEQLDQQIEMSTSG